MTAVEQNGGAQTLNARKARARGIQFRPRWHKVLADLWGNKVRSLLVIASISVGLFAIGMIATVHQVLSTDMRNGYAALEPANILVDAWNFDQDMVEYVSKVDGVQYAEGVRMFDLMTRTGPDEWGRMTLQAMDDFEERRINQLTLLEGRWPPGDHEIVVERNKLSELNFVGAQGIGGMVEIKLPSGKIRQLELVGVVHDQTVGVMSAGGGFFMAPMQGYIHTDTLAWLEQPEAYNLLYVTAVENKDDSEYLRGLANRVNQAIEDNHGLVYNAMVRGSHDHPNASYVDGMTGVLFALGAMVVFLSAFLITNTLSALLNQQAQQIAIMKTIGARSVQVVGIYMALIAAFGLLALALSLPLSRQAGFRMLEFLAERINFEVLSYRMVPASVALQVIIALLVPQAAGILPVLQGARVKVQDAISGMLTEKPPRPAKRLSFWRRRDPAPPLQADPPARGRRQRRLVSRPLLISMRNTFRHKSRLLLTLITLTLGGSIFIATFNVRASMESYIQRLGRYFVADINVTLDAPYRIQRIQEELSNVEGVGQVEGWAYASCELLVETGGPNNEEQASDAVQMLAPPVNSSLIEPILLKGRWLTAEDTNAVALSERFMERYPDLDVGDTLHMRVNGEEKDWVVVGFFQLAGKSAGYLAYSTFEYLSEEIHQPNRAVLYRVMGDRPNLTSEEQNELGIRIEAYLQSQGFGVTEVQSGKSVIENSAMGLNTLTTFLLVMAVLTALVGSIGLMGTMSMNVLDRTREIGVMRAIGASDRAVMNMVLAEGGLIGLISWGLGSLLAIPISKMLSDTIHLAVFGALSDFAYTAQGPLYWLGLVIVLSVLASVIPARSAARLTIREALSYE